MPAQKKREFVLNLETKLRILVYSSRGGDELELEILVYSSGRVLVPEPEFSPEPVEREWGGGFWGFLRAESCF